MTDDGSTRKTRRRGPRPATPERLEKAALAYLERYAASSGSLRRVLARRVRRSAELHGTDPAEGAAAIEAIVGKLTRAGFLDDDAFARGLAESLQRRGLSQRAIARRLAAKGLAGSLREAALGRLAETRADPELEAALAYARRRRLGPFAAPGRRAERRERDLAALARQGFPFGLALRVVDAPDAAAAEALAEDPDAAGRPRDPE
ncbi:regulatory protein [Tistlia consotensis]|uniref:Regulatory protein RecX n=1 Tax=Tistlia consotensis USBA 355 TaxID=560819 RepID=A0A1Y6BFH6_9PROT|nr:RecX family transcriptional regulator [Tistlia consotensis]SMF06861.1 regulatory protein [Tistlia consotensis USBA 355]SNR36255.1 regulatory protein [Tistlia consotensis]